MPRTILLFAVLAGLAPGLCRESQAKSTNGCLATTQPSSMNTYDRCAAACSTGAAKRFAACFGPGRGCVRACQKARDACEVAPNTAINACENSASPTSCSTLLSSALSACATDADPFECSVTARLEFVACNQTCATAQARAFETCVQTAVDCESRCPEQ